MHIPGITMSDRTAEVVGILYSCDNGFDKDIVAEAIELREELEPICLKALAMAIEKKTVDGIDYTYESNYFFNTYAHFLLGIWQSEKAFPLLIDIIREYLHEDPKLDLWADLITESFGTVMAECVTSETVLLLWELIQNEEIENEWMGGVISDSVQFMIYTNRLDKTQFESLAESVLLPLVQNSELPLYNRATAAHILLAMAVPFTRTHLVQFAREVTGSIGSWDTLYLPESDISKSFSGDRSVVYYPPESSLENLTRMGSWPCFVQAKKRAKPKKKR